MPKIVGSTPNKGHRRKFARVVKLTDMQKSAVTALVRENPGDVSEAQVKALARVCRFSPERMREVVDEARAKFLEDTPYMVQAHKQVIERSIERDTDKSLETARLGTEWHLSQASVDGHRIIESKDTVGSGLHIAIGVKIGGVNPDATEGQIIEAEAKPE